MSDVFADYGKRATSAVPPPLTGVNKTRAQARVRYSEIVADLARFESASALEAYLHEHRSEIAQFAAALEHLWRGGEDFLGLEREIERARARVDPRVDFPRWEPRGAIPESSVDDLQAEGRA